MWQKTERKRFVSKVFPQYLHASLNTAGTKEEELRKQLFFTHLYVDVFFLLHPQVTTPENENILIINKLSTALLKIGAKKSITNDRQIFPLIPVLIDIVTNLIVIYLFHFLHFPTSNIVVYGIKDTK